MRLHQIPVTGPSDKSVATKVNGAQSKDLNDCKLGGKTGSQLFAQIAKQRKSGLVSVFTCTNRLTNTKKLSCWGHLIVLTWLGWLGLNQSRDDQLKGLELATAKNQIIKHRSRGDEKVLTTSSIHWWCNPYCCLNTCTLTKRPISVMNTLSRNSLIWTRQQTLITSWSRHYEWNEFINAQVLFYWTRWSLPAGRFSDFWLYL